MTETTVDIRPVSEFHRWAQRIVRGLAVITVTWCSQGMFLYLGASYNLTQAPALALMTVGAFIVFCVMVRFFFVEEEKPELVRGVEATSYEEAYDKLQKLLAQSQFPAKAILWGASYLPWEARRGHFIVVGTSGSGKTVTIKLGMSTLLGRYNERSQFIPYIGSEPDHRAVMFDAKGELYPFLCKLGIPKHLIHTLHPFDERCPVWDVEEDIDSEQRARKFAQQLIAAPDTKNANSYFYVAPQSLITGVIYSWILTNKKRAEEGKPRINWTLRDLILAFRYDKAITSILSKHDKTRHIIGRYFRTEETIQSVLSTLDSEVSPLNPVAACWHAEQKKNPTHTISLRKWANDPHGSIILLGWDKDYDAALSPLTRIVFQRLTDIFTSYPNSKTRSTGVYLDEFRNVSKGLPSLSQCMNMAREKGVYFVLGAIDYSGVQDSLSEKVAAEVTGLCRNVAGLRVDSDVTAEWLSKRFGNADIREKGYGTDHQGRQSTHENIHQRNTFIAGDFQNLPFPSETNGNNIAGVYGNSYTSPYRVNWRGAGENGWYPLIPEVSEEETRTLGVRYRPLEEQELEPWTQEDLDRLEIDLDIDDLLERESAPKSGNDPEGSDEFEFRT